jgi:hypothetical protein
MTGRWGGRSSGTAGSRDFRRVARDENATEKGHRLDAKAAPFSGTQGTGRPPHAMGEHASGMSPEYVRGYDQARDGSRFELRYVAVESQPWHVVDSDAGNDPEKGPADKVKKFNTQQEAEKYIAEENAKALEDETDKRKELHYRKHPGE